LHHVSVDRLRVAYWAIRPNAAPGVDGVTWRDYGLELGENLQDLHAFAAPIVRAGQYRALSKAAVLRCRQLLRSHPGVEGPIPAPA
jgi:hypothetical protein